MTIINKLIFPCFLLVNSFGAFSQNVEADSSVDIACSFPEEIPADYSGGEAVWQKHLLMNFNLVRVKRKGAPAGSFLVDVMFLIKKDGSVDSVRAISHNGYGIEEEVVQAIQKTNKWHPAIRKGRNVPEWKHYSVTFVVPKRK